MNSSHKNEAIDPKTLVTPYAFKIAEDVLYKPLASPLKRALAIIVDGLIIATLAENSGWIFVCVVALIVVIHKRSRMMSNGVKWFIYTLMVVAVALALLNDDEESRNTLQPGASVAATVLQLEEDSETLQTVSELASYLPEVIGASNCEDYKCAQQRLIAAKDALVHSSLPISEQDRILKEVIEELPLSHQQMNKLTTELNINTAEKSLLKKYDESTSVNQSVDHGMDESGDVNKGVFQTDISDKTSVSDEAPLSSPLAWLVGLLNDMGLGFGWSAFYFTVFTAWFDGQTLGKKLLGISVIQLDGTKITLWASFGRYGGYAAGFTTGLLGFIQILWDANRQAIQDKISATVVIDLRKTKLERSTGPSKR